jgi:hypothetical protein
MALFKVTKKTKNGQESSLNVNADGIKTVRGLMQHRLDELKKVMDWHKGDSMWAEVIEEPKKLGYFERQRIVNEQREMDGDNSILGNPAY